MLIFALCLALTGCGKTVSVSGFMSALDKAGIVTYEQWHSYVEKDQLSKLSGKRGFAWPDQQLPYIIESKGFDIKEYQCIELEEFDSTYNASGDKAGNILFAVCGSDESAAGILSAYVDSADEAFAQTLGTVYSEYMRIDRTETEDGSKAELVTDDRLSADNPFYFYAVQKGTSVLVYTCENCFGDAHAAAMSAFASFGF